MITENSVPSENTEVAIIREIMVAPTISWLFVALFALVASSFRTRAALQTEILTLRHQLAVFQNDAPHRLRLHRGDRLLWIVLSRSWSDWRRCLHMVQPDTVLRCTAEHSPGIGAGNRDAFLEGKYQIGPELSGRFEPSNDSVLKNPLGVVVLNSGNATSHMLYPADTTSSSSMSRTVTSVRWNEAV